MCLQLGEGWEGEVKTRRRVDSLSDFWLNRAGQIDSVHVGASPVLGEVLYTSGSWFPFPCT
jgi:hypothetical protein